MSWTTPASLTLNISQQLWRTWTSELAASLSVIIHDFSTGRALVIKCVFTFLCLLFSLFCLFFFSSDLCSPILKLTTRTRVCHTLKRTTPCSMSSLPIWKQLEYTIHWTKSVTFVTKNLTTWIMILTNIKSGTWPGIHFFFWEKKSFKILFFFFKIYCKKSCHGNDIEGTYQKGGSIFLPSLKQISALICLRFPYQGKE